MTELSVSRDAYYKVAIRIGNNGKVKLNLDSQSYILGSSQESYVDIIDDDGWVKDGGWQAFGGALVEDSSEYVERGTLSMKIILPEASSSGSAAFRNVDIDLSRMGYVSMYVYGQNTGTRLGLGIKTIDNSWNNSVKYNFVDNFVGWRRIILDLSSPDQTTGVPDWTRVRQLVFVAEDRHMACTYWLDYLQFLPRTALQWFEAEPVWLSRGTHKLSIESSDPTPIDKLLLYSVKGGDENLTLERLFDHKNDVHVSFLRITPYRWEAHVKAERPFLLVFYENYDPLWRAYVGENEIKPMVVNLLFNAFYIDGFGEYDVVLDFLGQRYVFAGGGVSIAALAITSFLILWDHKKSRHLTYYKLKISSQGTDRSYNFSRLVGSKSRTT